MAIRKITLITNTTSHGELTCETCEVSSEFQLPPEPRNPMHRRTLSVATSTTCAGRYGSRHRKATGCKGSEFTIGFRVKPPQLVVVNANDRLRMTPGAKETR